MSGSEGLVDWGDKTVKAETGRIPYFKLEKGQKARFCILSQNAVMYKMHYLKNRGQVRCIADAAGKGCPLCEKKNEAKPRFFTNILRYITSRDGKLAKPFEVVVEVFAFRGDKFEMIRSIKEEYGDLRKHDLVVTCENSNRGQTYQKWVSMVAAKDALWLKPEVKAVCVEVWKRDSVDLEKVFGTMRTREEMLEWMDAGKSQKETSDSDSISDDEDISLDVDVDGTVESVASTVDIPEDDIESIIDEL